VKIKAHTGCEDIAVVYLAEMREGKMVEFLESLQPPIPREKKWVLIVSTLFGCPIKCPICDAGGFYQGKLTADDILAQIDFLVTKRYPDRHVPAQKFKIQFARMGEPSYNPAVLDVLEELPTRYHAPGLMPCISTIAPAGTESFFERLIEIKESLYPGRFQLQFSIHSTGGETRDWLIPAKKWGFERIAEYGKRFVKKGERKITLNFALAQNIPVEVTTLRKYFDPELFLIKITPLNPTYRASESKLVSYIDAYDESKCYDLVDQLRDSGYEVIVSIGEVEENKIGSNCGQYILRHLQEKTTLESGYAYEMKE
jgi:23S rRNA (adenine2503-C2)-methyltransferase